MTTKFCALNSGSDFHLLDHIAPLAEILKMPLITTEELNFSLAKTYYPKVNGLYFPNLETSLGSLAKEYEALFECKYFAPHLKNLFRDLYQKEMRLVFCPHGQSDKGFSSPLLAPYQTQDTVLLYGDLQEEMLKSLKIWPLQNYAVIGNFRLLFYQKNKTFYDAIAEKEVFSKFSKKQPILFYAPTWKDADQASSFFDHLGWLLSQTPSDWNLLIKPHPLLEQRDPGHFYRWKAKAESRPNVAFVENFPPVYPLLEKSDLFLGDFSSVGYDFLAFGRPMLFFPNSKLPEGKLRACGKVLDFDEPLEKVLAYPTSYKEQQESLFRKAFADLSSLESVKERIIHCLKPAAQRQALDCLN